MVTEEEGCTREMIRAVLSLFEGAMMKVSIVFGLLEESLLKVCVHQRSVLSLLLFVIVLMWLELVQEKI